MTGGVLVLINQQPSAEWAPTGGVLGPGCQQKGTGEGAGRGAYSSSQEPLCCTTQHTCHVPGNGGDIDAGELLSRARSQQWCASSAVLSVVTPVNQPDTAPGVVQWSSGPWHRLRQENICPTAHCHTMVTMLPSHS